MKVNTVKRPSDIELEGVRVEGLVEGNGTIRQLRLEDARGAVLIVERGDYGQGLHVMTKAPRRYVKRYQVHGRLGPVELVDRRLVESPEQAERIAEELRDGARLETKVVEVEVDEDSADASEVPF